MDRELKYFQGDFLFFCQFVNDHKIKKEDVLHVNTIYGETGIIVICFYYEG